MLYTCPSYAAYFLLLVLPIMTVASAAYETESMDPGLALTPIWADEGVGTWRTRGGGGDRRGRRAVQLPQQTRRGPEHWPSLLYGQQHTMFRRSQYLLVIAMEDETGRLLRYDPRTRNVSVLRDGLSFPNGVAVAADGAQVMVAITAQFQLRRYWVRGPLVGHFETFAELPGYPDNVRADQRGGYWVALRQQPDDTLQTAPTVAVRVDGCDGEVKEALDGLSFVTVSEVGEWNGILWVGSVDTPYAGALSHKF
uniref:Uncharacterized protein n=1 Tax=Avena sativa TaxID=4498 RepID=A0ACD5UXP2_AVESA